MRITKKLIKRIIIWIIVILVLSFLYTKIITPAYYSYKVECTNDSEGISIVGEIDLLTGNITICAENEKEYYKTLRHELCHYVINREGKTASCDSRIRVIWEEIRCNLWEYF